ncbi:MAG TPA: hypothetical protein VHT70_05760 [Candidatus Saccharimonadales bacterium]|jgi:hypothetical protein|nr:hypothetical protein [Candidatus Saccharimonadales bacterium]
MKEYKPEIVPVAPLDADLYMNDLYVRSGLSADSSATDILAAARSKWEAAPSIDDRVGTAELLLGRRIDGQELNDLPAEFKDYIFEAGHFEGLLAITPQIAEVEQD